MNASPLALPPSDPLPILVKSASGSKRCATNSVMIPFWRPMRRSWIMETRYFLASPILSKSLILTGFNLEASIISERAISQLEK